MRYYLVKFDGNYRTYCFKCKDALLVGAKYFIANEIDAYYTPITITRCITSKAASEMINLKNVKEITNYELIAENCPDDDIKNVYFNKEKRTTTILWKDGSYTTVKCSKNDTWDEEKAIALCYMKKIFNNRGCYNEVFKKYCEN